MSDRFEPVIAVLCCNWCTYAGADLAGTARMKYAPNVRLLRVMCSGRIDPAFVLRAFAEGADGVLIAGCHPGDCHYINGNLKTMRRFPQLKTMLAQFGIEPARVRLEWISASEGDVFVKVANEMTGQVRALGPLNWKVRAAVEPVSGLAEHHAG
ncbi:MAG: hydrogenase iron-sulfur subunit [Deltaproteobacteria bacterium]|nr:hydrogenase iron-sulfur subunit [Deltaproteobacteria bacterium]